MYRQTFNNAQIVETPVGFQDAIAPTETQKISGPSIAAYVANLFTQLSNRRRFIRDFHRLKKLPDHMLRDIGMHRGEINETHLRSLLKDHSNWNL